MKLLLTLMVPALCLIQCAGFAQTKRITFEAPDAYPEGTVFDAAKNVFYVSSARTATIGVVTKDGKYSVLYADSSLKSSYGMKIDTKQNKLWVCTGDANYSKFTSAATRHKMVRLIGIDLASGKKTNDINMSSLVPGEHFINDLTIDDTGNLFITDSYSPVIYKVDAAGKASVFAQNPLLGAKGIGLNGIVWHSAGFLLVANSGRGSLYKVAVANPTAITRVNIDQFFPGADGLVLDNNNTLSMVQNQGVNKIWQLTTTDNWGTARVSASTKTEDRFANPATATRSGNDLWIMNSKFNELVDSTTVPSAKFDLQLAVFQPAAKP